MNIIKDSLPSALTLIPNLSHTVLLYHLITAVAGLLTSKTFIVKYTFLKVKNTSKMLFQLIRNFTLSLPGNPHLEL